LESEYILLEVIESTVTQLNSLLVFGPITFSSTFSQRSKMMFHIGRHRFLLALELDSGSKTLSASFQNQGYA
jgi:hypothetical protein